MKFGLPSKQTKTDESVRTEPQPSTILVDKIVVNEFTEKPLSDVISEIKKILVVFQHQMTVTVYEKNGKVSEVEIGARIQL